MNDFELRLRAIEETNMSLAQLNKVAISSFLERLNDLEEKIKMIMDTLSLEIVETPAKKEMVFVWDECDCDDEECDCHYEDVPAKKTK